MLKGLEADLRICPDYLKSPYTVQATALTHVYLNEYIPEEVMSDCLLLAQAGKNQINTLNIFSYWHNSLLSGNIAQNATRRIAYENLVYFFTRHDGCSDEEVLRCRKLLLDGDVVIKANQKLLEKIDSEI